MERDPEKRTLVLPGTTRERFGDHHRHRSCQPLSYHQ
jgi:hypothetical protein